MRPLTGEQAVHLARLQAHPAPHHRAVATLAHRFNADPAFQYKLHLVGTYVFVAQIPPILAVSLLLPKFWATVGVLYVSIISLLANAQTEACNLPSAEAAMEAQKVRQRGEQDTAQIEHDIAQLARIEPGPEGDQLADAICKRLRGGP